MDKFQQAKQNTEALDRQTVLVKAKEEINHYLKEKNRFIFLGHDRETKEGGIVVYGFSKEDAAEALFSAGAQISLSDNEEK